ncbi:MAG: hypothetical protein WCD11_30185 [Solirubrobacteraceae bacterium]
MTEPEHPFMEHWWPPGHILGWEHTFMHGVCDAVALLGGRRAAGG